MNAACVSAPQGVFLGSPGRVKDSKNSALQIMFWEQLLSFHFLEVEVSRSPEGLPVSGGSTVYSFPGMVYSELDVGGIEEYTFCWLSQDLYFKKYYLINIMPSKLEIDGNWKNKPSKGQNLTMVGSLVVDQD